MISSFLFGIATFLGILTAGGFFFLASEFFRQYKAGDNGTAISLIFICLAMASAWISIGYLSLPGVRPDELTYLWAILNNLIVIISIVAIIRGKASSG